MKSRPLLIQKLRKSDLLRHFPKARVRTFEKGDKIVIEGQVADSCYFVNKGKVNIHKKGRAGQVFELGTIVEGHFFGEMAMLSGEKRSATGTALTPVEAVEITQAEFELVAGKGNALAGKIALQFAIDLADRSSRTLKLLAKQSRPPAGTPAPKGKGKASEEPVDVRQVLHKVYAYWAV
ncbi:Cyclic nucleotide-binding domain-containing protein [Verrucomicrobium sp. GAS474]|uniref:cyclic nucleotide-binding domain-containing protein n=1 Tax=Verrucomicrobium sp. GAS474 TaxID=1882831 RepID=UPI00087C2DC1|nr:cyclic nucleotide-binding domain-containing protein [Verrucomicrobium sp. GAS474]SDU07931.1 Cyclic nucleotide-binding domain-containing protein [Verrucomicrobium sp. GAS474]